ncbi:PQQ-binding-like beta-propeller repeat protein [Candidatus Pelagibacter sp.]|uniref:PQQ-binding-like beta-propeller repeat protein n=1 Tax=Candidatus Pelagibacter sp. TaxID=2024849 RepID=UPI003F8446E5
MNKILNFLLIAILLSGCSLNKNSSFWTSDALEELEEKKFQKIFTDEKALSKELNTNISLNLGSNLTKTILSNNLNNNDGRVNFDGLLKKSSKYKFSKIKNFYQFEPVISFNKNDIIFFDNKGTILKFNERSKLIWKKNYYSKSEKKLNPILQFANDSRFLIVADNIAKYYMLNLNTGELVWSKNNSAPFNSQIKIYKDKFFIIDFTNTLRCFSMKNGKEIWNFQTETPLIRSQKKLSMVIVKDTIYFNNSLGDISAVDIKSGDLLWQLPTQKSTIYEAAFSLETSDIIADENNLFFSNNNNQFFSIELDSGSFKWENTVNSNLKPTLVGNYLLSVSLEGYLIIIDKITGNIIKVTDVFTRFDPKKRNEILPTGFVVGLKNIYLSTNIGRLLVIDIKSGKTISTLKVDSDKISRPFIMDKNLYLVKDNAIIKLN